MEDFEREVRRRLTAIEYLLDRVAAAAEAKPRQAYTIREVSAMTGLGRTSVYEEICAGRLKSRKRGSATLVLDEDLQEYLRGLPLAKSA